MFIYLKRYLKASFLFTRSESLSYTKKLQAFRTPKINEVFFAIARLLGDLALKTKGLSVTKNTKSLFCGD
jgi:hypothetical protein